MDKVALEGLQYLANAARDRFQRRREVEWKICFGLWTGIALMTGAALNAETWKPCIAEIIGVLLFAVLITYTFSVWACVRRRSDMQDNRTAYYWESCAAQMLGRELPNSLQDKDWPTHKKDGTPLPEHDCLKCANCCKSLDKYTLPQVLTTFAFLLMLVFVICCKSSREATIPEPKKPSTAGKS